MADDVVADDRRKRDLVNNPGAAVMVGDVVLVQDVAAFDVTPQAGAAVVMHVVAAEDDAFADRQLDAAGFPTGKEFAGVVFPDAVALDQDIPAYARDADLAVVGNVAVSHARARCDS